MKTSEINAEANNLIKDLFSHTLKSDDKKEWKKLIDFVKDTVATWEARRWENMFIWRKVLAIISSKYGKKFITKK